MNFFVLFEVFVVYYLTVVAYYSCKIFVGNLSVYITKYLTAVLMTVTILTLLRLAIW